MLTDEEKQTYWLEALYKKGLGASVVQEALAAVLCTAESPLSADEIRQAVQRIRPETGRATVFRFIDKLTSLGLLQRIHGYRNCSTYVPTLTPHQAVLVCTECGKVSQLDINLQGRVFAAVEAAANLLEAHHITTYHLQLLGTCTSCKTD